MSSSEILKDIEIIDAEPEIYIVEGPTKNPIQMAGAAAHICYYPPTPSTVIAPEDVPIKKARPTAAYVMGSGHLTTWTHPHYTFAINNISRFYINEVLHDYPWYNTNQISGRYRIFDKALIRMPPFESNANKTEVEKLYKRQFKAYHDLIPLIEEDLKNMGKDRPKDEAFRIGSKNSRIEKMAIEAARYVLPMWQLSGMLYDANSLVVFRLYALREAMTTSWEHGIVARKMVEAIRSFEEDNQKIRSEMKEFSGSLKEIANNYPDLRTLINKFPNVIKHMEAYHYEEKLFDFYNDISKSNREILPLRREDTALNTLYKKISESPQKRNHLVSSYIKMIDRMLGGRRSIVFNWIGDAEEVLADAVRQTNPMDFNYAIGYSKRIADSQAIEYAMNPEMNPLLNHPLNLEIHDPISQAMNAVTYGFKKRCSWIADSQLIRHRTSKGQRPDPRIFYTSEPDVVVPELIERNKEALQIFNEVNQEAWNIQNMLIESGENPEYAVGVKPQAMAFRYSETINLMDLRHRFKQRTCLRAQEEVWKISCDELIQIIELHPRIGKYLGPPCIPRSLGKITPQCDQGYLWCGLPIWAMWGTARDIEELSYYPTGRKLFVDKFPSKLRQNESGL